MDAEDRRIDDLIRDLIREVFLKVGYDPAEEGVATVGSSK